MFFYLGTWKLRAGFWILGLSLGPSELYVSVLNRGSLKPKLVYDQVALWVKNLGCRGCRVRGYGYAHVHVLLDGKTNLSKPLFSVPC